MPEDAEDPTPPKPTLLLAPHAGPLSDAERLDFVNKIRQVAGLPPRTNQAAEEPDGEGDA